MKQLFDRVARIQRQGRRVMKGVVLLVIGGVMITSTVWLTQKTTVSTSDQKNQVADGLLLQPAVAEAQATPVFDEFVYQPFISKPGTPPTPGPTPFPSPTPFPTPPPFEGDFGIVFVSRQIPLDGSIYYQQGGMLPGTGSYSRFVLAAPGKLQIIDPGGTTRTLVDGSNPTAASLNLIDVNGPEVSYDGQTILFAGLPQGNYPSGPNTSPGAWRIYKINVDGSGLAQLTFSDQDHLDLSQFRAENDFDKYDDFDPVWLPDGRIVFASTRWPSLAMYNDSRTSNLFVMNADGSGMRRITSERNGAERPMVDPFTGRIVYSRWWRNFRNAANDMGTVGSGFGDGGYTMHNGLVAESQSGNYGGGPAADLGRNSWQLASINPDGTDLRQFAGRSGIGGAAFSNQAYGGTFAPDGSIYSSFYPMHHLSEAAGFGGIRHFPRGPHGYSPIIGVADEGERLVENPPSFRVFKGPYAADPEMLPDGRMLISWAADARQDYGLYTINPDGSDLQLVYDGNGTTEIRGRAVYPRPVPPIIADQVTDTPSLLPPTAAGPFDQDGTFVFHSLNVYFNAPVDAQIVNAIPVGSAATIRFFIDHQRTSAGFPERLDWPILLEEIPVPPSGEIFAPNSPANVPLFEQIRTSQGDGYDVPLTGGFSSSVYDTGAAHVAGHNFGRPGVTATCVGCHAGHSMIDVPADPADAQWTNLAPGAAVSVSSINADIENGGRGLIDRQVYSGEGDERYWVSQGDSGQNAEWIVLTFPVPVQVRTVVLHPLPQIVTADGHFDVAPQQVSVSLVESNQAADAETSQMVGTFLDSTTSVQFDEVWTRSVRIDLSTINGGAAGLAEIEVIARAGQQP